MILILLVFLDKQAFCDPHRVACPALFCLHRDLSQLDPTPFRLVQCRAFATLPEGHTGLVPGAYHLLAGRMPVAEATREELVLSARQAFQQLIPVPPKLVGSLLEHGKGHLAWQVRWLCTGVWPTLSQLLVLQGHDPFEVWRLPKPEAIALLPATSPAAGAIRAFLQAARSYYPTEQSTEDGLQVIATGMAFMQAAHGWWQEHESTCHPQTSG